MLTILEYPCLYSTKTPISKYHIMTKITIITPYPPFGIITSLFFGFSSFLVIIGFYCSAIYISENRDIRRIIRDDILKYDLLSQMSNRFIEDKTIGYINQIRKSSESDLFVDCNRLFLNDREIRQYVKDVINEIGKKILTIRIIKKNKKYLKFIGSNTDSGAKIRVYYKYILLNCI
jgi:hypothetical protein